MKARKAPPKSKVDIEIRHDKCAIKNAYGETVCYLTKEAAQKMGLLPRS